MPRSNRRDMAFLDPEGVKGPAVCRVDPAHRAQHPGSADVEFLDVLPGKGKAVEQIANPDAGGIDENRRQSQTNGYRADAQSKYRPDDLPPSGRCINRGGESYEAKRDRHRGSRPNLPRAPVGTASTHVGMARARRISWEATKSTSAAKESSRARWETSL